jgi:hypothetical protein
MERAQRDAVFALLTSCCRSGSQCVKEACPGYCDARVGVGRVVGSSPMLPSQLVVRGGCGERDVEVDDGIGGALGLAARVAGDRVS